MAVNCAGSYCFCSQDDYQGNKIFEEINTNLINEEDKLSEEAKKTLENCEQLLKEFEKKRQEIADKFKELLIDTGACVICKPTLERAVITYIIYSLEQVMLCAKEKNKIFDSRDFALSNFINIKKENPFLTLNQETIDKIKTKYELDINMVEQISKAKSSLLNFLSTAFSTKDMISNQSKVIKNLLTSINLKSLTKIHKSLEGINFIFKYYAELTSGIISIESQLTDPKKLELFYKIANDAAEKGIKDPKEFALRYSLGETCGSVDNWKENIGYKKIEILKY